MFRSPMTVWGLPSLSDRVFPSRSLFCAFGNRTCNLLRRNICNNCYYISFFFCIIWIFLFFISKKTLKLSYLFLRSARSTVNFSNPSFSAFSTISFTRASNRLSSCSVNTKYCFMSRHIFAIFSSLFRSTQLWDWDKHKLKYSLLVLIISIFFYSTYLGESYIFFFFLFYTSLVEVNHFCLTLSFFVWSINTTCKKQQLIVGPFYRK